jgi:hypothetical protein
VRGLFPSFEVGDLSFTNALAKVTGEFDATGRYHGLLGLSVFSGYRVTLDLKRRKLLLDPAVDEPGGDSFWWVSGQMLVRATTANGESGLFIFDTGASGTVLSTAFVEGLEGARLGPAAGVQSFGGIVDEARLVDDVVIEFAGRKSRGPLRTYDMALRSKVGGIEVSGLVGLDLLVNRPVVVHTVGQKLQLP